MKFLLVRISLGMSMGGHLLACLWFFLVYEHEGTIGEHIQSTEESWQVCLSFVGVPPSGCLWRLYSLSLNMGIYLLLGIDRDAYSALEHFFLTFCLPLGALVHALVLGEIILLLQRRSALDSDQDAHTQAVHEAMRILSLPAGLQVRIITYFTYERLKRCGRLFNQFFTDLSPQLRFELQLHMYLDLVVQTGLFKNMRPRVIREIVLQLDDLIFLPGDWICRYGDYGDSMYFVTTGSCTIIAKDAKTTLKKLERGSYFGEVALLTGVTRTAYVLAETFSIVAHLTKDGLEPIMKKWPEEIDTILSGLENAQDRARIKEEAYRHYRLNGEGRRGSRSGSRRASREGRRMSCDPQAQAHRRMSFEAAIQRKAQEPVRGKGDKPSLESSRLPTIASIQPEPVNPLPRSQSITNDATNGKSSVLSRTPVSFQSSLSVMQSTPLTVVDSVVDSPLNQTMQSEINAPEGTPDEMMQIESITKQLADIVAAVAALSKEVQCERESLALSLAELKQTLFESMREAISHDVGNTLRPFTPSDCGDDGGLEAMVI
eukprot:CAMPEP_0169196582 /NCGR_PEP_ID=MMETSP1016-20121227/7809_1 /TAXON_ID=342587 /ORGANISM="Karlodinium micrum, Strain CCMP2283" /LENGTH=544 /DNA_ID=CAMNT_0009273167 /DNA_START=268 /DNA_END=1902 /DNA_ORIENTATION=-